MWHVLIYGAILNLLPWYLCDFTHSGTQSQTYFCHVCILKWILLLQPGTYFRRRYVLGSWALWICFKGWLKALKKEDSGHRCFDQWLSSVTPDWWMCVCNCCVIDVNKINDNSYGSDHVNQFNIQSTATIYVSIRPAEKKTHSSLQLYCLLLIMTVQQKQ